MKLKRLVLPILATVVLTVLATLIVLNLRAEKKIAVRPVHLYPVADQQFLRSMSVLLGPPLVDGNRVETLLNGDRIFPSMLQAISGAKQTIDFETYIYWSGEIGKRFAEALAERARAGVKVNVLVDWLGSQKMDNDSIETMTQAGVDFRKYRPLRWYNLGACEQPHAPQAAGGRRPYRFTGGVGIADNWTGRCAGSRSTGATITIASKALRWRRCRPRLWTTGPRSAARFCMATRIFRRSSNPAGNQYAQVFQSSSRGRLREHASDVFAVDRRGDQDRSIWRWRTSCRMK